MNDQQKKPQGTSHRGFASMDAEKKRELASKGGKAAHESGHAHEFSSEEARIAGRKGGQASHSSRRGSLAKKQLNRPVENEDISADKGLQSAWANQANPDFSAGTKPELEQTAPV